MYVYVYMYIHTIQSESITINLQIIKIHSVKTFSLQRFVVPAT